MVLIYILNKQMKKELSVTLVTTYLLAVMGIILYGMYELTSTKTFSDGFHLLIGCVLLGATGGVLYCLRGVYLNYCVKAQWTNQWIPWYLIRPFTSAICGGISYLFLKAGLLVLEAQKESDASNLGFYALAFIAGMNVDKFISKIEDLAQATWGIEKSRSSKFNSNS
jgi:hypothetical protein